MLVRPLQRRAVGLEVSEQLSILRSISCVILSLQGAQANPKDRRQSQDLSPYRQGSHASSLESRILVSQLAPP